MATRTRVIGALGDGAGQTARLEYDYDDVSLNLLTVRVVNGLSGQVSVQVRRADGRLYGPYTCAALSTTERALPQNTANRLRFTLDSQGRLVGAHVSFWS